MDLRDFFIVVLDVETDKIKGINEISAVNGTTRLTLSNGFTPQTVLKELVKLAITIEEYQIAMPTLDEIFIQVVQGEKK